MSRELFLINISKQLSLLQIRAKNESKLTLLNTNVLAEDFYCGLLNAMFDWNLVNANAISQNAEGIDLIDGENKLFVQVSATRTHKKVQHSLDELDKKEEYQGFRFKFVSIADSADNLRNGSFKLPKDIFFTPSTDVYDVSGLLSVAQHMCPDKLSELNKFVDAELGALEHTSVYSSGLSYVVSKLSLVNLESADYSFDLKEYRIEEKIKFNNIGYWEDIVQDYKIYDSQLKQIYSEYDQLGQNKSLSIQDTLKTIYRQNKRTYQGEALFDKILEESFSKIRGVDDAELSEDEIRLYLKIILVDAFIECQIFEKPI